MKAHKIEVVQHPDEPVGRKPAQVSPYFRFGTMIAFSTIIMYALMYLNTFTLDHVFISQTRAWMALIMGSSMALVMLLFMRKMYSNHSINLAIAVSALAVFGVSLWLVRSQRTVGDVSWMKAMIPHHSIAILTSKWMKAMIPHHSIAILTSKRAQIKDPRVRDLADRIIESQAREIEEMKGLIRSLEHQ